VALVCDDQLYVKPTEQGHALIGTPEMAQPFAQAKPYFLISGDLWEDGDWLAHLIRATADALPTPKPKAPKKKKPSASAVRSSAPKTTKKSS
jgi:TfoX/Sxy family transcriptional regulator of competence genes